MNSYDSVFRWVVAGAVSVAVLFAVMYAHAIDNDAPDRTVHVYESHDCIAIDTGDVQRAWAIDTDELGRARFAEISWRFASFRIDNLPAYRGDHRPAMAWPAPPFGGVE